MIGLIALQGDNSLMPAGWFMHKFTKEKRTKKENFSNSNSSMKLLRTNLKAGLDGRAISSKIAIELQLPGRRNAIGDKMYLQQ